MCGRLSRSLSEEVCSSVELAAPLSVVTTTARAPTQHHSQEPKLRVPQRVRNDELHVCDSKPHARVSTCVYYDTIFNSRSRHENAQMHRASFPSHQTREGTVAGVRCCPDRQRSEQSEMTHAQASSACDTHTFPAAWMRRPLRIRASGEARSDRQCLYRLRALLLVSSGLLAIFGRNFEAMGHASRGRENMEKRCHCSNVVHCGRRRSLAAL